MRKITILFAIALFTFGWASLAPRADEGQKAAPFAPNSDKKTFAIEVACDARTFKVSRGLAASEALRGDSFIVNGKIFPVGTLPSGNADNDPNDPGSIGAWTCRGVFNFDFSEIQLGAAPHVAATQIYDFGGGDSLVSEGLEGGVKVTRAVIGGTGRFSGASGEVVEEAFGVNGTGLFNIRFTFKLKNPPRN